MVIGILQGVVRHLLVQKTGKLIGGPLLSASTKHKPEEGYLMNLIIFKNIKEKCSSVVDES